MHTPCVKPDGDTARETARVHPKSRTRPTSAQVKNTLRRVRLTCCQFWGNPVSPRGLPPSLLCPRFFGFSRVQQNNLPSFKWRHLLSISVRLFKQLSVLSMMNLVSCKHRLHVMPLVADGLTFFKIDHCILHSLPSSANFQTYLESSVAFLPDGFLKDIL